VWEQMYLAYEHGADRLWIVNVGDIKPMEFPIEFFLDFAWNPKALPADKLDEYTRQWAAEQFGDEHAAAIADVLTKYTRYNARRKPELLDAKTYSLINYREAERVVEDYDALLAEAERINESLPADARDAYYQLVLHPVQACANLNKLYLAVAKNQLYAKQGRAATSDMAQLANELFDRDAEISRYYNSELAGGKWNHMMDQTHIGYTNWQEPPKNRLPRLAEVNLPAEAEIGVAVEGSSDFWPGSSDALELPILSAVDYDPRYVEVFNRSQSPCSYSVEASQPYIHLVLDPASDEELGQLQKQQLILVSVDWAQAPQGIQQVPITITGPNGNQVVVTAVLKNEVGSIPAGFRGFVDTNGYLSMEAESFDEAIAAAPIRWLRIPTLGRTQSGMTITPTTSAAHSPGDTSPRLEYRVLLSTTDPVKVQAHVAPTLNFHNLQGLRYAISFDDQPPQVVNIHAGENLQVWEKWVGENVNVTTTEHELREPGEHVLKFWAVDPGVVLEKLVVDTGDLTPSYLGPPESTRWPTKNVD